MLRIVSSFALAAAVLGSASVAMAAPRHSSAYENGFRATYQQNLQADQRTSGFIGPASGSRPASQVDRTGQLEN